MNRNKIYDIVALSGMGTGMLLILQPWWGGGFHAGFFMTLICTVMHIFTSHMNKDDRSQKTEVRGQKIEGGDQIKNINQ